MTESPPWLPLSLRLASDPIARNKCLAATFIKQGTPIFAEESFAALLLDREKGKRCDACFRISSKDDHLKKCSGCGSYWYCDVKCQMLHWALHHKRICQKHNSFIVSGHYQALPEHEKLDALLLSYTIARFSLLAVPYIPHSDSQAEVLMSLLPHPTNTQNMTVMAIKLPPPDNLVNEIYRRFGNNNFLIHSHLTGVGHGVFPFASRVFNHSCMPNAIAKYQFSQGKSVVLQIVALRDIHPKEEICIPYLDPALSEIRGKIFQISYGFKCACPSCIFINSVLPLPPVPTAESDRMRLAGELCRFAGINSGITSLPIPELDNLPVGLRCVLREDYISNLSEDFSKASHEGDFPVALNAGLTLLALYLIIYPPNYPQIGMQLLELTKTAWNAQLSADMEAESKTVKERVRTFLSMSREVLMIFGSEGDQGGPISEIEVLENLLSGE